MIIWTSIQGGASDFWGHLATVPDDENLIGHVFDHHRILKD